MEKNRWPDPAFTSRINFQVLVTKKPNLYRPGKENGGKI